MIKDVAPYPSLWAWIDLGSWRFVTAIAMFGSVLVLGWGSELVSAAVLFAPPSQSDAAHASKLSSAADRHVRDRSHHIKTGWWRLAQLVFPLFLTIAIYSKSVFGLPFLCLGLWKFGYVRSMWQSEAARAYVGDAF